MMLAKGPRPWPIRLFAALFAGAALATLASALLHLDQQVALLASDWPAIANHDGAIVLASARFTIALIPVGLVWLLASRVARWLVLAMTLLRLAILPQALAAGPDMVALATLVAALAGTALLFTPQATQWLNQQGTP